jgi:hypothetical protein
MFTGLFVFLNMLKYLIFTMKMVSITVSIFEKA